MSLPVSIILMVLAIVITVKGGDWFVDASSWIAEKSGIPKLIIGATVVSIATTLPEMLVSSIAAAEGKVDMSIGNAVGSVTANIGLIMAIALLFMPAVIKRKDYLLKSILMLVAAVVIAVCGLVFNEVSLLPCLGLLVIFAWAMFDNVREALRSMKETSAEQEGDVQAIPLTKKELWINIAKFVFGAGMIVGGAKLLVESGSALALNLNVPERIISVTLVAIGTSLPELVTTVTAIVKKQPSLSAGNIIGANIFDLTLIMPISCLISGQSLPVVSQNMKYFDLPAAFIVGCIALIPTLITKKFSRWQGVVLLLVYGVYIYVSCFITL